MKDDAEIARSYAEGGIHAARAALPHLSVAQIYKRARKLGVSRRARWTPNDDKRLRGLWGAESVDHIATTLHRTTIAVYWRAQKLDLGLGVPQGLEYLSQAAVRTGYATSSLRRVLKWAGVKIRATYSRGGPSESGRRYHCVDPADVDDAIERWHRTETVESAARRHGTVGCVLYEWLVAAGHTPEKAPSHHRRASTTRLHMRVVSALVDRIVVARAALKAETETLSAAGIRTGVGRTALGRWLVEAGVERAGYHWRVRGEDVDRVVAEHRRDVQCRAWRRHRVPR